LQTIMANRFNNVTPRFDGVTRNPESVLETKYDALSAKFYKAGDISQLGIKRAMLDSHLAAVLSQEYRSYTRPGHWGMGHFAAMRFVLKPACPADLTAAQVAEVQETLKPKERLTEEQQIRICQDHVDNHFPDLIVDRMKGTVALWVQANRATNTMVDQIADSALTKSAANAPVGRGAGAAATVATTGGGGPGPMDAFDVDAVEFLTLAEMSTLANILQESDPSAYKDLVNLMGLKVFDSDPSIGIGFKPFTDVILKAEVDANVMGIPASVKALVPDILAASEFQVWVVLPHEITLDGPCDGLVNNPDTTVLELVEEDPDIPGRHIPDPFAVRSIFARNISGVRVDGIVARDPTGAVVTQNLQDYSPDHFSMLPRDDYDWFDDVIDNDRAYNSELGDNLYGYGAWRRIETTSINEDMVDAMKEYAIAVAQARFIDVNSGDAEIIGDMCVARSYAIRKSLFRVGAGGNRNRGVRTIHPEVHGYVPFDVEARIMEHLEEGFMGPLANFIVFHSFMKSGHHVTANNLGRTFMSCYAALLEGKQGVIKYSPEKLGIMLGSAVYPGCHFTDKRLVAVHFRTLYAEGLLSFAFGRRLAPLGPGTVAAFLLKRVFDALNEARFWEGLKKEYVYEEFCAAYNLYEKGAQYETPYAQFMYGQARPESQGFKNIMTKYAAYAASLHEVMPDSSYTFSVALVRDTSAAAGNSIVANLEVKAFVAAYRRYVSTLVQSVLAKKAQAASGGRLAIES
jgi:hypothetical protein